MENYNRETIEMAVKKFKGGGVVVFPTDTVHGIGCVISDEKALERVYQIKGREMNQPSPVLVGNVKQAEEIAQLSEPARQLINHFWPGGLTIVVLAKENKVPKVVQGSTNTVGLRMPNFPPVLKIIKQLKKPILGTSANYSKQPPAVSRETLDERVADLVDYILPGNSLGKEPSTVLDLTQKEVKVIREGAVPLGELDRFF
jgi:L-threonylcarbamoyladenylate synthase